MGNDARTNGRYRPTDGKVSGMLNRSRARRLGALCVLVILAAGCSARGKTNLPTAAAPQPAPRLTQTAVPATPVVTIDLPKQVPISFDSFDSFDARQSDAPQGNVVVLEPI